MPVTREPDPDQTDPHEAEQRILQPPLFELGKEGRIQGAIGIVPDLNPDSSLDVARYWYRRYLEQSGHPHNTIKSYSYDLAVFETMIGPKTIQQVKRRDIAHFLGESNTKSTRKRRLTSVSGLFKFLITQAQVLESDPSSAFYPEHIPLKTPHPLFADEQARLLASAAEDGPRAHGAIWLMLRLGLSRAEVLQIRVDHVDVSDPERPVVYVFYESPRHRGKERKLAVGREFGDLFQQLIEEYQPREHLFPILPQTLNKIVERVTQAAGLTKHVSPQSLRDTFAVDRAREGATEEDLLRLLGLADDSRNRMSVRRYIKLAEPPLLGPAG